mmetsp:Transcript_98210/g.300286  ORF Transcript_98210/g.300286 Transcript_98210/m.300286 type:complete len:215 (+) Transcript_98210:1358-2002(+)
MPSAIEGRAPTTTPGNPRSWSADTQDQSPVSLLMLNSRQPPHSKMTHNSHHTMAVKIMKSASHSNNKIGTTTDTFMTHHARSLHVWRTTSSHPRASLHDRIADCSMSLSPSRSVSLPSRSALPTRRPSLLPPRDSTRSPVTRRCHLAALSPCAPQRCTKRSTRDGHKAVTPAAKMTHSAACGIMDLSLLMPMPHAVRWTMKGMVHKTSKANMWR